VSVGRERARSLPAHLVGEFVEAGCRQRPLNVFAMEAQHLAVWGRREGAAAGCQQ
jgi:hypothetical protein